VSLLEFDAELQKPPDVQVVYIVAPFSVQDIFGAKGQVKVRGTIHGESYRSSLQPMGDGTHSMIITKAILSAIGKTPGDTVHVMMEEDTEERIVTLANDFRHALERNAEAQSAVDRFAYSQRKLYMDWIKSARKPEKRENRIQKAVQKIVRGEKFA
jgi:hypothetical protein